MPRKICTFSNGGLLEFDTGRFDSWCVYVTLQKGERFAPSDIYYFTRMKELGKIYGSQKIYDDFVVIFNRTTSQIKSSVLRIIAELSRFYEQDAPEIEMWFAVLYAGMVAEENKENAILKKRIKRLGMHQLLIDKISPEEAASFSKGKNWKALDVIMRAKGF